MKLIFLSSLLLATTAIFAQPKMVTQATIYTTTNVIAPEEEDVSQVQNQGGGGGFNFRNFAEGETKSTTFIKNDQVKINLKSETFKGSIFRDNTKKTTTTIFEIMGNTQGFISTDEDQAAMLKRMDSMREARANTDTNMKRRTRTVDFQSTVSYLEDTKKIAGFNCKKALIITDRLLSKDTFAVWYTPEIKFANVPSTGGTSGIGVMAGGFGGATNFEKIDGFVMQYERNMPRGRVMEVKVTKIDLEKAIAANEFDIPKDVEIKSAKDMNGQGGGMRMFMGGR